VTGVVLVGPAGADPDRLAAAGVAGLVLAADRPAVLVEDVAGERDEAGMTRLLGRGELPDGAADAAGVGWAAAARWARAAGGPVLVVWAAYPGAGAAVVGPDGGTAAHAWLDEEREMLPPVGDPAALAPWVPADLLGPLAGQPARDRAGALLGRLGVPAAALGGDAETGAERAGRAGVVLRPLPAGAAR
jgi:hypothetical protein